MTTHPRTTRIMKAFVPLSAALATVLAAGCSDGTLTSPGLSPGRSNLDRAHPTFSFNTVDVSGALSTSSQGINAGGAIVGGYTDANHVQHGFLLQDGVVTTIDYPGAGR